MRTDSRFSLNPEFCSFKTELAVAIGAGHAVAACASRRGWQRMGSTGCRLRLKESPGQSARLDIYGRLPPVAGLAGTAVDR